MKTKFLSLFFVSALIFVGGCASPGNASFKPATKVANYSKTIDSQLLVVFEISYLTKAFVEGGLPPNTPWPTTAANTLISKLTSKFAEKNIQLSGEIINSATDNLAYAKALSKYPAKKHILTLQTTQFQTSQSVVYGYATGKPIWNGNVQFTLQLYDRDYNIEGTRLVPVWTAKTENVHFGYKCTSKDQPYEVCAENFASVVVTQLAEANFFKK